MLFAWSGLPHAPNMIRGRCSHPTHIRHGEPLRFVVDRLNSNPSNQTQHQTRFCRRRAEASDPKHEPGTTG